MQDNLNDQSQQPSTNPRNTPERLKLMTGLMLAFAIINSVNLVSVFIPFVNNLLFISTFVLAIIILFMAPKGYKTGWAAWFEIAAEVFFVGSLIVFAIGARNAGISVQNFNALAYRLMNNGVPVGSPIFEMIQRTAMIAGSFTIISFIVRIVSVVFGYVSYSALKKGQNAGM